VLATRLGQARDHGLDDLIVRQALEPMQDRRIAHLEMPHVLAGHVFDQLAGHAVERLALLKHAQRVVEDSQVVGEIAGALARLQDSREPGEVPGRQPHALGVRQIEHRARAQAAVEVAVDVGLGKSLDDALGQSH